MASLIIYEESDGEETIFETYELTDMSILIGSDADNHLVLDTPDVDSNHASLELRDGRWVLQDLGGPGGTAVNGQIIEGPFTLYHADLIELNRIKLKFHDPERGVTKEFPRKDDAAYEENDVEAVHIKGRVWCAGLAVVSLIVSCALVL